MGDKMEEEMEEGVEGVGDFCCFCCLCGWGVASEAKTGHICANGPQK